MEHQFINALARDKVRAFSPDNSHSQNGTPVRERDRWQRGLRPGGLIPGAHTVEGENQLPQCSSDFSDPFHNAVFVLTYH